jgi:phosphoglycolate phosphatase
LTNKPTAPSERILAALGLRDAFDEVVGGDGPHPRKPDPAALNAMMASASATARHTLLVGDSAIDLETARRAGVACCLVSYGFGFRPELRTEGPDLRVADDAPALARAIDEFTNPG